MTPEYITIELTDIQLHRLKATNPRPLDLAMARTKVGKPGRFYGNDLRAKPDRAIEFSIPLSKEMVADLESGRKKLRLLMPKKGLPIRLGKDAEQFFDSKAGKRALAKLNKK